MYSRIILLIFALFMSSIASAEEINIRLGSDTARFMYTTEAFGQDFGRLELEAGFLYNQNDSSLINVGLLVRGEGISVPLIVSIGARAYYGDSGNTTIGALAIGGDFLLQPESWGGIGAGVYFYTAPSVVAFADADGLTEYGGYVNFQLTPQVRMALGYQEVTASIINAADVVFDKAAYFELNLSF